MKALILGGTGAMGVHLCQLLIEEGWQVYVSTRSERVGNGRLTYIKGNAHDELFLKSLLELEEWDSIVDFMNYSTVEFKQRYELLVNSTKHYIYLSSSRVYAESIDPITEKSPRLLDVCNDWTFLQTDDYSLAKARQEDCLLNFKEKNWTIIRPYITYSNFRLQLTSAEKEDWLFCVLNNKPIIVSRDLLGKYTTLTYGYDVARGIYSLMGQVSSYGEIFNITTNESILWEEILENYLRVIEKKKGKRPTVMYREKWDSLIGGDLYQVKWDRMYNRCFDNSKINQYIDTNTFQKTLPTIASCLESFMDTPRFDAISWPTKARQDRYVGVWTNLLDINDNRKRINYLLIRLGLRQ